MIGGGKPSMNDKTIIGNWKKVTSEVCADRYPDELQFLDAGIYLTRIPDGEFKYWQSGDYEFGGDNRIRIQTANDAMQAYEYSIDADGKLLFIDDKQCQVEYRRIID